MLGEGLPWHVEDRRVFPCSNTRAGSYSSVFCYAFPRGIRTIQAGGVERSRLCRSSPRISPDDGLQFGEAVFHVPAL